MGKPTVKQLALIEKLGGDPAKPDTFEHASATIDRLLAEKRAEQNAARAEALANVPPCIEGKGLVTGEVKSVKVVHGDYGATLKITVEDGQGNRYYVTAPSAIRIAANLTGYGDAEIPTLRGRMVKIWATWKRSAEDLHFAFGSRPQGTLLDEGTVVA